MPFSMAVISCQTNRTFLIVLVADAFWNFVVSCPK